MSESGVCFVSPAMALIQTRGRLSLVQVREARKRALFDVKLPEEPTEMIPRILSLVDVFASG